MPPRSRRGLISWLMSSKTPVFLLDDRHVVLVFNRGCEELTQWTAADVIGKACQFQTVPNPDLIGALTGILCPPVRPAPGEWVRRQVHLQRKDGTAVEKEIHYFLLEPEGEGEGSHVLGIIADCAPPGESVSFGSSLNVARHTGWLYSKYRIDRIVAVTPAMQRVAAQIDLARHHTANVHLSGEKGVGKEHIARLIHYGSELRSTRFVPIRCATASHYEILMMFDRLGDSSASHEVGTVYLDSVTDLPGDLQRILMERLVHLPVRWISSSLTGLDGLTEEEFSSPLAAQLTALTIRVPPLRSRGEDIPLLAQQLLEECNSGGGEQHTEFSPNVIRQFLKYPWPGNIDELSQVVQEACRRATSSVIDVADLPLQFTAGVQFREVRPPKRIVSLDEHLMSVERDLIVRALHSSRGNKAQAAEILGIPRAKLYRRLEALGLVDESERQIDPETQD